MRRLLAACVASLLLYTGISALLLDKPLSLGLMRAEIEAKLARGSTMPSPKLVILAGSNGPYSHRCETIEPILRLPCVNAGVAVGVGLDYLFARWQPLLHPGDVVYLPLEEAQYIRTDATTAVGPDAAMMLRHDWATLSRLTPRRWLGAAFALDLRGALSSLLEMALAALRFHDPRAAAIGQMNAWGDHVGHTPALGEGSIPILAGLQPHHIAAWQLRDGDGTRHVVQFLYWSAAHGVRVVGGLPTEFDDAAMPAPTRSAIAALYRRNGGRFLDLPNHSAYPRDWFFDTAEHLNEPAQIAHSRLVADALRRMLDDTPPRTASAVMAPNSPVQAR